MNTQRSAPKGQNSSEGKRRESDPNEFKSYLSAVGKTLICYGGFWDKTLPSLSVATWRTLGEGEGVLGHVRFGKRIRYYKFSQASPKAIAVRNLIETLLGFAEKTIFKPSQRKLWCIVVDSSTETWMNIDAYKDQETYEEFTKVFKKSNPEYATLFKIEEEIHSIIVPNSIIYEIYIEKPELRID
jgi:hypothetical protein